MAIYYVRTDGNDGNTGLGPAAGLAWRTIQKALGATGIASGDTVYIAPGSYTESVTIGMTSATATTSVIGDPTVSQFIGIAAGPVLWTVYTNTGTSPTLTSIIATSKNYLSFRNIVFDGGTVAFTTSANISFTNCQFTSANYSSATTFTLTSPTSTAASLTIDKCSFIGGFTQLSVTGQNVSDSTKISDSLFLGPNNNCIFAVNIQIAYINNSHFFAGGAALDHLNGSTSFPSTVTNTLIYNCGYGLYSNTALTVTQTYNRIIATPVGLNNIASSVTTTTTYNHGVVFPYYLQNSLGTFQMFTPILGGPNTAAGIATGAPASDMYGVTWTGATPDTGSATYRNIGSVSPYIPTERNASAITIAPASTSQSIELYLGATGLTYQASGLQAYYARNRSAPVQITLANQTATGSWISGGFAEISSGTMPGLYRLDVPDAAFASGSSDVTITVRGASGTNGAVLTVNLSPVNINLAQSVPTSNTAQTVGDALNAARAYGFGKWVISGTTLSLYASDNTTVIKTFTLDSGSYPTSRT